ncbi:MAG: alpha/beta hydrolase [Myxococcota bacterium]
MSRLPGWVILCLALLGLAALACVGVRPSRELGPAGSIVVERIELLGAVRSVSWYLPAGDATALVVFEHGFLRRCENLRETTRRLMAVGLMGLCVDASMRGGNPALAEQLARALVEDGLAPAGREVPRRLLVAGHSAGALFAVTLGATLDAIAPDRLAGALLIDPVAGKGFEDGLRAISAAGRRPVLVLLAPPHRCNADSNALPALRRVEQTAREAGSSAFELVLLGEGATHADVEGEDTGGIAEWSCGRIRRDQTERLRALASDWVRRVAAEATGGGPTDAARAPDARDEGMDVRPQPPNAYASMRRMP